MADQIQILRGTRDEIVTAKTKLLEGQPLYNETDKYLTIGSSAGLLPKEQSPIKVRAIEGYVEDNEGTLSSSPTEADRYYVGPTNDAGDPTLHMHGTNLEITAKGTGVSEGLLSIKGKDVNITGTNMLNVTSSGSIQLSASDLNISGLGFEVHSTDTNDGSTVIKMGTNTGIGGNYVKIGYTGATGSTSVYNISTDTNFDTDQIYTAPAGTPKMDAVGATGTTYAENSAEKRLAPIIYNIGQRLDSLGFKEELFDNEAAPNSSDPDEAKSQIYINKCGRFIQVQFRTKAFSYFPAPRDGRKDILISNLPEWALPDSIKNLGTQEYKTIYIGAFTYGKDFAYKKPIMLHLYKPYQEDRVSLAINAFNVSGEILADWTPTEFIELRPPCTFGYSLDVS